MEDRNLMKEREEILGQEAVLMETVLKGKNKRNGDVQKRREVMGNVLKRRNKRKEIDFRSKRERERV